MRQHIVYYLLSVICYYQIQSTARCPTALYAPYLSHLHLPRVLSVSIQSPHNFLSWQILKACLRTKNKKENNNGEKKSHIRKENKKVEKKGRRKRINKSKEEIDINISCIPHYCSAEKTVTKELTLSVLSMCLLPGAFVLSVHLSMSIMAVLVRLFSIDMCRGVLPLWEWYCAKARVSVTVSARAGG